MLDNAILEQLKSVFQTLENELTLVVASSHHQRQKEMASLVQDLASTSEKISVRFSDELSDIPKLSLVKNQRPLGVHYLGVPGGHEFTSLVLSLLNADGKGKLPDKATLNRIRGLQGPIELKTYVSLSCENCPEVVQALNLMALIHPGLTHTMIDGELTQDEVHALGIQGVPSVMSAKNFVSSGKTTLVDLIGKLESMFGTQIAEEQDHHLGQFDVVVLGAGPGGSSAAIYSARKGLKTAVIAEKIGGQVQETKGIENLISVKYTEGPQLASQLDQHLRAYDIALLEHRRVKSVLSKNNLHTIELESGEYLMTKSLIVATGAKWRELGIPGEKELLGRGVAFCPHCDGPYYKGKDIAVIGGGNSGVEAAIDLAGIANSVTLIEFNEELKADQILVRKLKSLGNVKLIRNARLNRVIGKMGKVTGLEYEERLSGNISMIEIEGIFVQIGLVPNSAFLKGIVELNEKGEIIIDEKCRTSVKGIYAAGDVTNVPYKQIIVAMGEGAKAGLTSFEDMMLA